MSYSNNLIFNYLNSAFVEAEVENAISHHVNLTAVKFDIVEENSSKLKDIIKFIYSYLDFKPLLYEQGDSYVVYMQHIKLHTSVLTIKNLMMSLKLKFGIELKNVAITEFSNDDDIESFLDRLNKFYMKGKLSRNQQIYYGTKDLDFNNINSSEINKILNHNPKIDIYGLFQDSPIKIEATIASHSKELSTIEVKKDFLQFLNKQQLLYIEHKDIPDIFTVIPMNVDFDKSILEVGEFKFVDHSPLHRKNTRVAPHKSITAKLIYGDFEIIGLISDISKNSILFSTEIQNIEMIKQENMDNRSFDLTFILDDLHKNSFNIDVKATIFKTMGNQLVLNIHTTRETKGIIKEYINMCYQLLLLQVQGKVV